MRRRDCPREHSTHALGARQCAIRTGWLWWPQAGYLTMIADHLDLPTRKTQIIPIAGAPWPWRGLAIFAPCTSFLRLPYVLNFQRYDRSELYRGRAG
jgi:hypothetical protein